MRDKRTAFLPRVQRKSRNPIKTYGSRAKTHTTFYEVFLVGVLEKLSNKSDSSTRSLRLSHFATFVNGPMS